MVSMCYCYIIKIDEEFSFGITQSPRALVRGIEKEKMLKVKLVGMTILGYNEAQKALAFIKKLTQKDLEYWSKQSTKMVAIWISGAGGVRNMQAEDCSSHLKD